jgi:hypothetical protein
MRVELPETRYKEVAPQTRFRKQVLAGMNSLPGVQAAMISELPLSGDSLDHDFIIENRPPIAPGDEPSLETRSVLGDYFKVMQIPLKQGRDFGPQDFDDHAPLVKMKIHSANAFAGRVILRSSGYKSSVLSAT